MSVYVDRLERERQLNITKAQNAAAQGHPTMWAHYLRIAELLGRAPSSSDAVVQVYCRDVSDRAIRHCPTLPPRHAAELWALSVNCRRILGHLAPDVTLNWLRSRAARTETELTRDHSAT